MKFHEIPVNGLREIVFTRNVYGRPTDNANPIYPQYPYMGFNKVEAGIKLAFPRSEAMMKGLKWELNYYYSILL